MQAFSSANLGLKATNFSQNFHEALNLPGYVPFVGIFTGAVRAITALAATIFFNIAGEFTTVFKQLDFKLAAKINQENIGRGILEMIPFIGGFILYQQDNAQKNLSEVVGNMLQGLNMQNMFQGMNIQNMGL